jgi:hypothetical protein
MQATRSRIDLLLLNIPLRAIEASWVGTVRSTNNGRSRSQTASSLEQTRVGPEDENSSVRLMPGSSGAG